MSISRRDALRGATAAAVTAGVPIAAMAEAETDHELIALERQWLAWRDYCHSYPDDSDEARNPLFARLEEIEERIYATPARTARGVTTKLRLWAYFYAPLNHIWTRWWEGDVEQMELDEKGLAMVMRDLDRLAGGMPS